ncbi:unnamed protein product [Fraxinus pennsylvanica]|uniref:Transmembrane protein n=1 Tax=Fraxinus pennsylvanica TaxID=56036 RepID=A0AAD1Z7X3_9LAMI|nr:unnamed protein product [Fraxinus pennsylvanica]
MTRGQHRRRELPPPIDCGTTAQILRRTATIFYSHLLTFLLLSFLLFHFRQSVEEDYDALMTENAPSIKALLSRTHTSQHHRVHTLDHDFFANDPYLSMYFETSVRLSRNSSFSDLQFILPENLIYKTSIEEEKINKTVERSLDDHHTVIDLGFLIREFKLSRHDVNLLKAFLFNACYLYTLALVIVVVIFSWLRRAVLHQVANHLLGKNRSCIHILFNGVVKSGIRNILPLIYMKWIVMAVLALVIEFLSSWYKIQNLYMVLVVFLRAMYDPLINLALWVQSPERETIVFIVFWFLIDLIVGFIFSVGSWVVFVDGTTNIVEIEEEMDNMFLRLQRPARDIRILEAIICGSLGRLVLWWIMGGYYSLGFQCVMEVYFMVAWLVYYCSARARLGRTVGRKQLKAILAN